MLLSLVVTSIAIALLAFIAGFLPLVLLTTNNALLNRIQASIAGILLSTSLVLILPEAMEHANKESKWTGPLVLFGFMTLFTMDAITSGVSKHSSTSEINIDDEIEEEEEDDVTLVESGDIKSLVHSVITNSTTMGLLLHCLSDGVLLTTSLMSSSNSQSSQIPGMFMIIAIFIHKLPAAFSLTSILISQGLRPAPIVIHLALFSISAPIGAWLTYILLLITNGTGSDLITQSLLLFSCGAFIYVAFHTLQRNHENQNSILFTILGTLVPFIALPFND